MGGMILESGVVGLQMSFRLKETSSIKAVRIGKIFWPLTKIPPVSDYSAEPTTCCRVYWD